MSASTSMWLTFFFSLFLALMTDRYSVYSYSDTGERIYSHKNKFFYTILAFVMVTFVGLRIWCNDTGTYREIYDYFTPSTGSIFFNLSWRLGKSPGFELTNRVLKRLNFSTQSYLMFYSAVTDTLYLWFIRKYSKNFTLSVFLFWTLGVYMFSAAAIRQCVAIALGLVAVDGAAKKNWKQCVLWCVIGSMFHPYVLLFLIAPFLQYPPWTKKSWLLIGACVLGGVSLTFLLPMILNIATVIGRGDEYTVAEFSGDGVNVFRLFVIWAPVVLSFFLKEKMQQSDDRVNNMFMNLTIVNAGLMFIALFGTANYFARLANYFLIFQTVSLPWMLKYLSWKNQRTMKIIVVLCYLLYFIFANVILTPFNTYFAKMSLWEYLRSLF